jgi:hypothetical protein
MIQHTLHDIIKSAAHYSLVVQREDGSFPPGHNGPYFNPEIPIRNTGRWLIIF